MSCFQVTTGASDDFNEATDLAEKMVLNYGMSDAVGVRTYRDVDGWRRSELVEAEISRLLNVSLNQYMHNYDALKLELPHTV